LIDKDTGLHVLRGERYSTEENKELALYIRERLHFLDYDEACAFYRGMLSTLDDASLALLGCNDRFFLLTALLGRKDAIHPWLYARCREVEANPDGFLDLWAREHYKSTVITFAGIIQEILADPEMTVGLFSFRKSTANDFLKQIKRELETNEWLKRLYEDVLYAAPTTQSPLWSVAGGLVIKRKTNPKEPTVMGSGLIDGMPTGMHFRLMVYDDVIELKSVGSPDMVRKATEAWEMSDNLGAGEVRTWTVGTRYSFADTYGVILDRGVLIPRIYPATDDGSPTGKSVFISETRLKDKLRKQRSTFAAQMLQNPLAGNENTFKAEWLQPWYIRPSAMTVYITVDPSKGRSATSDRTAIAVIGIDQGGNKYLLDGYRHRMTLSERWTAVRDLYRKWSNMRGVQMVRVGYEAYGQQTDKEYFEERMMLEAGISFKLDELNWVRDSSTGQSKKDRVERLEPDFRLGRFYLPALVYEPGAGVCWWELDEAKGTFVKRPMRDLTADMQTLEKSGEKHRIAQPIRRVDEDRCVYDVTTALMEEMLFFPFAPKDDLVDAVSRIYDMDPIGPAIHEDERVQEINKSHDFIDA
jgi:hypothetical protein